MAAAGGIGDLREREAERWGGGEVGRWAVGALGEGSPETLMSGEGKEGREGWIGAAGRVGALLVREHHVQSTGRSAGEKKQGRR